MTSFTKLLKQVIIINCYQMSLCYHATLTKIKEKYLRKSCSNSYTRNWRPWANSRRGWWLRGNSRGRNIVEKVKSTNTTLNKINEFCHIFGKVSNPRLYFLRNEHYTFFNSLSRIKEPTRYEIAKFKQKWCKTMDEELHTLGKKSNLGSLSFTKK
jgi:hypothetical protein